MIYKVKITFYCDWEGEDIKEYVIFIANSYAECVDMIIKRYGEDNIIKFSIEYISDDNCITFDESHKEVFKDLTNAIKYDAILI